MKLKANTILILAMVLLFITSADARGLTEKNCLHYMDQARLIKKKSTGK